MRRQVSNCLDLLTVPFSWHFLLVALQALGKPCNNDMAMTGE